MNIRNLKHFSIIINIKFKIQIQHKHCDNGLLSNEMFNLL